MKSAVAYLSSAFKKLTASRHPRDEMNFVASLFPPHDIWIPIRHASRNPYLHARSFLYVVLEVMPSQSMFFTTWVRTRSATEMKRSEGCVSNPSYLLFWLVGSSLSDIGWRRVFRL